MTKVIWIMVILKNFRLINTTLRLVYSFKHMLSFLRDPISHAYLWVIGVIDWQSESIVMSVIAFIHNRINGLLPLNVKHCSSQSDKYPIKIIDMWVNMKSNIIMTHVVRIYAPIVNTSIFLWKGILMYIK